MFHHRNAAPGDAMGARIGAASLHTGCEPGSVNSAAPCDITKARAL
jgi:hypothetical protein